MAVSHSCLHCCYSRRSAGFAGKLNTATVLSANGDSERHVCLQSYQGHVIDRSIVY